MSILELDASRFRKMGISEDVVRLYVLLNNHTNYLLHINSDCVVFRALDHVGASRFVEKFIAFCVLHDIVLTASGCEVYARWN